MSHNIITDLLAAPLGPDWTVDELAERVISAVATEAQDDKQELVIDAESITDRQVRRLLRPLLACLATKSATEAETYPNIYGGTLLFKRPDTGGSVWIFGRFENTPVSVRAAFQRFSASMPSSDLMLARQGFA